MGFPCFPSILNPQVLDTKFIHQVDDFFVTAGNVLINDYPMKLLSPAGEIAAVRSVAEGCPRDQTQTGNSNKIVFLWHL